MDVNLSSAVSSTVMAVETEINVSFMYFTPFQIVIMKKQATQVCPLQ